MGQNRISRVDIALTLNTELFNDGIVRRCDGVEFPVAVDLEGFAALASDLVVRVVERIEESAPQKVLRNRHLVAHRLLAGLWHVLGLGQSVQVKLWVCGGVKGVGVWCGGVFVFCIC